MATSPSIPPHASLVSSSHSTSTNKISSNSGLHSNSRIGPPLFQPPFKHSHTYSLTTSNSTNELTSLLINSLLTEEPIVLSPIKVNLIPHPLHRDLSTSHILRLAQSILDYGYVNHLTIGQDDPPIAIRYFQKTEILKPFQLGQPPSSHILVPEINKSPVYYVIAGADRIEAIEYALRIAPHNENLINMLKRNPKLRNSPNQGLNGLDNKWDGYTMNHNSEDDFTGGIEFYVLDGSKLSVVQVLNLSSNLSAISLQRDSGTRNPKESGSSSLRLDKPPLIQSKSATTESTINASDLSFNSITPFASTIRNEDLIQQLDRFISESSLLISNNPSSEVTVDRLIRGAYCSHYMLDIIKQKRHNPRDSSSHNSPLSWLIWICDVLCPYFRDGTKFDIMQHEYAIPGLLFPNFATQIRTIINDHIRFDIAADIQPEILGMGLYSLISICKDTLKSILKDPEYSCLWNDASFFDLYSVDTINKCENWKPSPVIPLLRLNTTKLVTENVTNTWSSLSSGSSESNLTHLFQYLSLQRIFHMIGAACVAFFYSVLNHQDDVLMRSDGFSDFASQSPIFLSKISELAFKCSSSSINLVQCNENLRLRVIEASSLLLRFAVRGGGQNNSLLVRRWSPFPAPAWSSSSLPLNVNPSNFSSYRDGWITLSTWKDVEDYIYDHLLLNIVIPPPHLLLSPSKSKQSVVDSGLERRKPEVMTVVTNLLDNAHRSRHNIRKAKVIRGDPTINDEYELKIIDASALPMARDALNGFIENILPISSRVLNQFASQWIFPATDNSGGQIIILPAFIPIMGAIRISCSFIPPQFDVIASQSVNWIEARGKLARWIYQQSVNYITDTLQKTEIPKGSKVIYCMANDPKFELKPIDMEIIFENLKYDIENLLRMIQSACYTKAEITLENFWKGQEGISLLYSKVSEILSKLTNNADPIIIHPKHQSSSTLKNNDKQETIMTNTYPVPTTNKKENGTKLSNNCEGNTHSEGVRRGIINKRSRCSSDEREVIIPPYQLSNYTSKFSSSNANTLNLTKQSIPPDPLKPIIYKEKNNAKERPILGEDKTLNLFEEWLKLLPLSDKLPLQQEIPYVSLTLGTGLTLPDLVRWRPPLLSNDNSILKHFPNDYSDNSSTKDSHQLSILDWKIITAVLKLLKSKGIDTLFSSSKNVTFFLGENSVQSHNFPSFSYASPTPSLLPSPSHSRSSSESRSASPSAYDIIRLPDDMAPLPDTPDDHLWMIPDLKLFLNGVYDEDKYNDSVIDGVKNFKKPKKIRDQYDITDYLLPDDKLKSLGVDKDTYREKKKLPSQPGHRTTKTSPRGIIEAESLGAALNNFHQRKSHLKDLENQNAKKLDILKNIPQTKPSDLTHPFNPLVTFSPFLPMDEMADSIL